MELEQALEHADTLKTSSLALVLLKDYLLQNAFKTSLSPTDHAMNCDDRIRLFKDCFMVTIITV
jgi:hypothetical protein